MICFVRFKHKILQVLWWYVVYPMVSQIQWSLLSSDTGQYQCLGHLWIYRSNNGRTWGADAQQSQPKNFTIPISELHRFSTAVTGLYSFVKLRHWHARSTTQEQPCQYRKNHQEANSSKMFWNPLNLLVLLPSQPSNTE